MNNSKNHCHLIKFDVGIHKLYFLYILEVVILERF